MGCDNAENTGEMIGDAVLFQGPGVYMFPDEGLLYMMFTVELLTCSTYNNICCIIQKC